MSKMKTVLMALVAVLAVSAVASANAFAAAEFNAASFPVKFKATGGKGYLETVNGNVVECQSSEVKESEPGKVVSKTEVNSLVVHFKKCKATKFLGMTLPEAEPCHSLSPLGGTEEIITKKISGEPVDVTGGAGVLLHPETAGTLFAEFECVNALGLGTNVKVKGSIIGKGSPINEQTATLKLTFEAAKGKPVLTGALLETSVEGLPYEESGIQEAVPGETTTTALEGKTLELKS